MPAQSGCGRRAQKSRPAGATMSAVLKSVDHRVCQQVELIDSWRGPASAAKRGALEYAPVTGRGPSSRRAWPNPP